MKPAPFISIIINNYNYEKFVSRAINSALTQTYSNVEVIVVDDDSTDGSQGIIASYTDHIIPILHKVNGKQGAAFNSGFARSQGDIILFLDADDYLYPNAVECVVEAWEPNLAKVHYRLDVVNSKGEPRGFSYPQGNQLDSGDIHESILSVGTYTGVPTSGNAISRWALEQVMPIPTELSTVSDDYLSVLIPLYGKVASVETSLGAYRIHTSNQWAISEVTSDRFHRFIHHDLQRCELIKQHGNKLGFQVPENLYMHFFGRAWSRLASLRLDPQRHPVQSDHAVILAYQGIRSLWLYSQYDWRKQVIFSLWFLWVSVAPRQLAKPAIVWLFAPHLRPQFISQIILKIKTLIDSTKPSAQTS